MSSMNVNYMTKTYDHFLQRNDRENQVDDTGKFREKVAGIKNTSSPVSKTAKTTQEMTMEEYKEYIQGEISKLPIHPSQMNTSFAVNISEAGFEAMKKDPEYEKWVLETLRVDFAFNDPWAGLCGGSYSVFNFGATKEDYSGQRWFKGYQNGNGGKLFGAKSQNSTWKRRADRKKELDKQYEKQWIKKKIQEEEYEKYLLQKSAAATKRQQILNKEALQTTAGDLRKAPAESNVVMQEAVLAYETQIIAGFLP